MAELIDLRENDLSLTDPQMEEKEKSKETISNQSIGRRSENEQVVEFIFEIAFIYLFIDLHLYLSIYGYITCIYLLIDILPVPHIIIFSSPTKKIV